MQDANYQLHLLDCENVTIEHIQKYFHKKYTYVDIHYNCANNSDGIVLSIVKYQGKFKRSLLQYIFYSK